MKYVYALVLVLSTVIAGTAVDWQSLISVDIDPKLCIHRHNVHAGRITKGETAGRNQFPYQVGLMLYLEGGAAWCGGTLISDRHVITAAHCTDSLTTGVDVYLGAWNRTNKREEGQQIIFVTTKYVTVHEGWDASTLTNDISVIKLPVPIELNEYIQPAQLPVKQDSYNAYDGDQAIASGWGKISDSRWCK